MLDIPLFARLARILPQQYQKPYDSMKLGDEIASLPPTPNRCNWEFPPYESKSSAPREGVEMRHLNFREYQGLPMSTLSITKTGGGYIN